jgi:hypothetical protein
MRDEYSNVAIAMLIHSYMDAAEAAKVSRPKMLEVAVTLGHPQGSKGDPLVFLDGFLAGQGCLPEKRRIA